MSESTAVVEKSLRSVFVGNIPYEATEEKLREIFSHVGPVASFKLMHDRESGKPKGYGFCEYKDQETALSAMRNLNGYEIGGRPLRVDNACTEKSRMEMQSLMMGPVVESPYGPDVEPTQAPEAISNAVASLPPEQMFELMRQMQVCVRSNRTEARTMLLNNPQLAYALLQAQVVMRIIDPKTAVQLLHGEPSATMDPAAPITNGTAAAPTPTASGPASSNGATTPSKSGPPPPQFPSPAGPPPTQRPPPPMVHRAPPMQGPPQQRYPPPPHQGGRDFDLRGPLPPPIGSDQDMRMPPNQHAPHVGSMEFPPHNRPDFEPNRFGRESRGPPPGVDFDHREPNFRSDRGRPDRDNRGPPPERDNRGPPSDRDARGPPPDRDARGPPPDRDARGPPPDRDTRGPPPDRDFRGGPEGRDSRGRGPPMHHPEEFNRGPPSSGPPPPSGAASLPANLPVGLAGHDQEKASLIMQVLQLSDDQIRMLDPDQQASILQLKEQIQQSQH